MRSEYLPLSQASQADEATPLKEPRGQSVQVVLSEEANLPSLHGEQNPDPGKALKKPRLQEEQTEPSPDSPFEHAEQPVSVVAVHSETSVSPGLQVEQELHEAWPEVDWKVEPASQEVFSPAAQENPASHSTCPVLVSEEASRGVE